MIYSTATVPVNPEGEIKLTREQIWKGLELKARDAREFLPPKQPNGPEEQAEQAQFDSDKGYRSALLSTLKRTRELVAEGRF